MNQGYNRAGGGRLRIAAMLLSFSEEKEGASSRRWSTASRKICRLFRGGDGMLEPYIEFSLSLEGQAPKFDKDGVKIQRGTGYCRIPCRRR